MRNFFKRFAQIQTTGGILLAIFTLLALSLANSPLNTYYQQLIRLVFRYGGIHLTFLDIVNNGLMTIFFFFVSLEIKRELLQGELNSIQKALLPTIAAVGGMLVPAFLYLIINRGYSAYTPGWAIPMATDIAFSLGVLSLLNKKIPYSLKIFLTALAIIDDLGAIFVIAVFYTQHIGIVYLMLASCCLIALITLNYFDIDRFFIYLLFALALWFFILKSGVHPTIAGVLFGFTIPSRHTQQTTSLLKTLENRLHPWVAHVILPLFAFSNAGLSFTGLHWRTLTHPLPLGIIVGLFFGKQCGIMGTTWLAVKLKYAKLPRKTHWGHIYGTALICGISFTMSLFIANLSFSNEAYAPLIRLGVLAGSVLSAIAGYAVLFFSAKEPQLRGTEPH